MVATFPAPVPGIPLLILDTVTGLRVEVPVDTDCPGNRSGSDIDTESKERGPCLFDDRGSAFVV